MTEVTKESKEQVVATNDAAKQPSAEILQPLTQSDESVHKSKLNLDAPQKKTKGEKLFDGFLYGGIGYFANFVFSVLAGHAFLKGKWQKGFEVSEQTFNKGFQKVLPEKWAKKISMESARILCLGAGGHLVMIPIKMLEDRKKRVVYWLNSKFFPNEYDGQVALKPASQMRDDELPEVVEQPSKMSWGRTAVRRLVIYLGIGFGLAPLNKVNHWTEGKVKTGIYKGVDAAQHMTGSESLATLRSNKHFKDYVEVGAADLYVSAIAAILVKLTNGAHGLFGKKKEKAKDALPNPETPTVNEPQPSLSTVSYMDTVKPRAKAVLAKPEDSYAEMVSSQKSNEAVASPSV